jgi:hypothetical protein
MNTTTQTNASASGNYTKYDAVNSLFNCGIYFYNGLVDYATNRQLFTRKNGQQVPKTYMKYNLKFADDPNYEGFKTEMQGFVRIIKTNAQNNSIKRVLLYRNHNKGETVPNVQNLQVMQIEFKNNAITAYKINDTLPDDYKVQFEAWVNFIQTELTT